MALYNTIKHRKPLKGWITNCYEWSSPGARLAMRESCALYFIDLNVIAIALQPFYYFDNKNIKCHIKNQT